MQDNILNDLEHVSLEELGRLANVVSLESASAAQFLVDSRARFSQFFGKADNFFKRMSFTVLGSGKVGYSPLLKAIDKYGFVDASQRNVITPKGFVGLWAPYAGELYSTLKDAVQLSRVIAEYNQCLGQLIADPDQLKSAAGIPYSGRYDLGIHTHMVSIGQTYFDPKNEGVTRQLGAVVERVADIPMVYNSLNDAILLDKTKPSTEVTKLIARSMELSKKLVPLVEENPNVSKPVREQLIQLTYSIAREVEAYSTLLYRIRQFSLALEDSPKELLKV